MSDKEFLWTLRLSVVIMAAISTLMACMRSNIYELVAESSIVGMVSLLVPITAALYWKKANQLGAMLAMLMGLASWLVFEFIVQPEYYSFLPALFFSILGMFLGNTINRKKSYGNN
jgi:Na+/proline symporter